MALKTPRPRARVLEDDEEVDTESTEMHLYKVTFKSVGSLSGKSRAFVTFGTSEEDAVDRIWGAYKGSSFSRDYDRAGAYAEFILGGILRVGGS